jgi:hypothetical protein
MLRKLFISAVATMALVVSAVPGSAAYRYRVGPGAYYGRPYYYGYAPRANWNRPYYGGYYRPGYYNRWSGAPYGYPGGGYYNVPPAAVFGQGYYY